MTRVIDIVSCMRSNKLKVINSPNSRFSKVMRGLNCLLKLFINVYALSSV